MSLSPSTHGSTSSVSRYLTLGLYLLLLLLIASTIILGSVPPVDRDALTHHLFVPKLYLQYGGIYEIADIPFSYYPMNLDLLYMIPMYFGNDIVPKYIHYLFALLTTGLIFHYLKKQLSLNYALLGSLFFLSIPIIVKLSITVYVDLGVVFFTTASLLLLLSWAKHEFKPGRLILAGLCCGLAAGTKYNGIVSIVVLTLLVPVIFQRYTSSAKRSNCKALAVCLLFLSAALTTFSPWLIRNTLWTGNPIYPLHNTIIQEIVSSLAYDDDTQTTNVAVEDINEDNTNTSSNGNHFTKRKLLYGEQWWQAVLLPIRFFFEGRDDDPRYFDGKLSPFLLLLPALAILFKSAEQRKQNDKSILVSFAILYFFFTFFQETLRIRYVVAIVPALVIVSIYGVEHIFTKLTNLIGRPTGTTHPARLAIAALVFLLLGYNSLYIFQQFTIVQPIPYLLGQVTRDQYITAFRPEYPVIKKANAMLTPDTKVLCIFMGNRGYYMDFKPVFEQPYHTGLLADFLRSSDSRSSVLDVMKANNISYILFRDDLTMSWWNQLQQGEKSRLMPLFNNAGQPISKNNNHTVFAITEQ